MPAVGPILHAAANLTGLSPNLNADIAYTGLVGNFVRLVIVATVGFVIVRAIVLRLQQASHRTAILHSVEQRHGPLCAGADALINWGVARCSFRKTCTSTPGSSRHS